ncbi:MAG: hypothetical protein K5893_06815 [Prevotella sp.]|nr:hypothetical protein [Prevotella sp.]
MDFGKLFLKVVDVVKDAIEESNNDDRPTQEARPAQSPDPPTVEREKTDAEWVDYFKEILMTDFSSYTIRENVPVTDLVGFANDEFKLYETRPRQAYKAEWGQPYTFVLETDGQPKGVVMLGNGHSHDSGVKYLIARMYAKKLKIPYINFYTQMPNERSYVVKRISFFME